MNRNFAIVLIICAFFAGSILSGTSILAASDDKGNPFENIQQQIDDIINGNISIEGESKILFLGTGAASPNKRISYGCVGFSQSDPLSSCTRTIPLDGQITDLTASSNGSGAIIFPGTGESYKATLVKNGIDTDLSCVIANDETTCQNTSVKIQVFAGDRIDLKITGSENPNVSSISASALLRP